MAGKRRKSQRGKFSERREPIWDPLLELLPADVGDFMWMGEVRLADGTQIQLYKHYWIRRYLMLDRGGRIWIDLANGRFEEAEDPESTIRIVFADCESGAKSVRQNECPRGGRKEGREGTALDRQPHP